MKYVSLGTVKLNDSDPLSIGWDSKQRDKQRNHACDGQLVGRQTEW